MSAPQDEKQQSHRDRVVDEVVDKVSQRQAIDRDEVEVRQRAEEAVDGLIEEPVQTFTPLLAENEVVTGLVGPDRGAAAGGDLR
ncbi:hypothetical protein [Nocardioides sp. SYSU DS0663]|uniref:hypothetical protein n=1 Tax=Nocardioides sp. SYSU DS0663 TaxID=3416445 RepID=UPI003F4B5857